MEDPAVQPMDAVAFRDGLDARAPLCPICRTTEISATGELPAHQRILSCAACDLIFIWPRRAQEFSDLPEEAYYGNWEQLDFSGVEFLVAEIAAATGRTASTRLGFRMPPTVLDAGCGAGHVLINFRAHGWSVQGVDPWAAVTAAGRKYYRLPILTARLEDAEIAAGSQDVVLALDVLQFIAEPRGFLEACRAALVPGGLLYLTVPNFGSAEARRDGLASRCFLPLSYLSYFTEAGIKRLLHITGFRDIEIVPHGGPQQDLQLRVYARGPATAQFGWADLSDSVDDRDLPPLDRGAVSGAGLSIEQCNWREQGYLILPGLIPDDLVERYCEVRSGVDRAEGWISPTPYLEVPEIRDLCLYRPLIDRLEALIGEPMGLHLNLTGWVSTERDWHQDDYLNPPQVNGHYAAVWIALDTIHPDAGPFEFVPGSHRWPIIRQAKVLERLGEVDTNDPSWPWRSERLLTPFFESEIRRRGAAVQSFLGNRGDVLIWHARLLHRGSLPRTPGAERRSLIAHYSAISHRPDMPMVRRHQGGGRYFVFDGPAEEAPSGATGTLGSRWKSSWDKLRRRFRR